MATTVDFAVTQIISVLRADMTLIQSMPFEIRELDLNVLRAELKDLEAGNDGMPWPDTNEHTAPKTVAGVTLSRVVEIKEPYTLTFENGLYAVNVVGGNSNIADITNKNSVGVNTANSAGNTSQAQLEADIASLIAASNIVHFSVAYAGSTIQMNVWLERLGETITSPVSCQVDWYTSSTDTLLFTATDSSPDARGNFDFSEAQALTGNVAYYCDVSVTDASGTVTERRGVPTVG